MSTRFRFVAALATLTTLGGCATGSDVVFVNSVGTGVGALAGGLIGSRFGQGVGKVAATGLGSIVGAGLGNVAVHNYNAAAYGPPPVYAAPGYAPPPVQRVP